MILKYRYFLSLLALTFALTASAHISPPNNSPGNPNSNGNNAGVNQEASFRNDCQKPEAQIDQDINNVRARLTTGGDVWWDRSDGKYIVPKPTEEGDNEVSSIFAGGVWIGGIQGGSEAFKVAAQQYGNAGGNRRDFWTGPLNPSTDPNLRGTTADSICQNWDRFWVVTGAEIEEHIDNYNRARELGEDYDPADIPLGVKGWPGKGNEFFLEINNFELPNTSQGLGAFEDVDENEIYSPQGGDYPIIEIEGCEDGEPQYPDQMFFWIYNDAGNIHTESDGDAIKMEIQVQSFAYETNDALNDMTFQRYKLINRASVAISDTYFAMWVDADLGCYTDDYIGCDTTRSLAYYYNVDEEDGTTGVTCEGGVPTYGTNVPALGIDYFRGPKGPVFNQQGDVIDSTELGMSSFTYFNNPGQGGPPAPETDPTTVIEYYNYLRGLWRDGSPFTFGGNAYGGTEPVSYAFPNEPSDNDGWSMCTAAEFNSDEYDRRTVQASGPFTLLPGAVNELIIGAVWVPDFDYPCPEMNRLFKADDLAQNLFDSCFDIQDGPDAPDIDLIELDREIILVLTNGSASNNFREEYEERDITASSIDSDTTYNFQGYKVYQLIDGRISASEYDDPDKARLIAQVDVRDDVSTLYNWEVQDDTPDYLGEDLFVAVREVTGSNNGIRHTFSVKEDRFATGNDSRLVNQRKYYFSAIAYGFNIREEFDPVTGEGQAMPYLEGRRNINTYIGIPRPINDVSLNAEYGDGAQITRLDGVGTGPNFLDLTEDTRNRITESGSFGEGGRFSEEIVYEQGMGPIQVTIYNPLDVRNGDFKVEILPESLNDDGSELGAWRLTADNFEAVSEQSLEAINEQIIGEYGISVSIGQVDEPGTISAPNNGALGYEEEYIGEGTGIWYEGVSNRGGELVADAPFLSFGLNFVNPDAAEQFDPNSSLVNIGGGFFPYKLAEYQTAPYPAGNVSPAWQNNSNNLVRNALKLEDLNNVDIVFTDNKDLWSRCVVVETSTPFVSANIPTIGDAQSFDLRQSPSVGKTDSDGDGMPDLDASVNEFGMGWFPGYAIDVETGQRLNIFFGENSSYRCEPGLCEFFDDANPTGGDMIYNPTSQFFSTFGQDASLTSSVNLVLGGQHHIYVTDQPYDKGAAFAQALQGNSLARVGILQNLTWTGVTMLETGSQLKSYADGLIPNDLIIKLRVNNRYDYAEGVSEEEGTAPTYTFSIDGKQASDLDEAGVEEQLDGINMVPNPYYGFSDYEGQNTETTVKITNLPAKCVVSIYTLDGKFIRRYNRDETGQAPVGSGIAQTQIVPHIDWDLKNSKGIPIAGGVYLVHIDAGELGERVIKWFGTNRAFDPSNL